MMRRVVSRLSCQRSTRFHHAGVGMDKGAAVPQNMNVLFGTVLDGTLPQNKDYAANRQNMDNLVTTLKQNLAKVYEGGGAKMCARHKSRGKLLARERINACIDTGSPFLELSALSAFGVL
jgi:hypothetical protein